MTLHRALWGTDASTLRRLGEKHHLIDQTACFFRHADVGSRQETTGIGWAELRRHLIAFTPAGVVPDC